MRILFTVIKVTLTLLVIVGIANAQTATPTDYLIMQSTGGYHSSGKGKCGNGAGFLEAAGHFGEDHHDITCRTGYYNTSQDLAISVLVSQHTGTDSDQWLPHELDKSFRTSLGIPGDSYGPRQIDGQNILDFGAGGREYRWLSGNKVIRIEYTDLQMTKPEPLEVVRAYLTKHPSTLPVMTLAELRSAANKTTWIKEEMSRRLWLCDKWVLQIQTSDPKLYDKLKSIVDSMTVFLNYREKYYGMASASDKNLLSGYLGQKNDAGIRAKLAEYKAWWTMHKADAISLP